MSTTAVNAYVGPVLERYLSQLEGRLRSAGYKGPALITLSHGGVTPIDEAVRLAAGTVLSALQAVSRGRGTRAISLSSIK